VTTNILGISAFYHDSAACLVRDGEIIAAAQEERFTRKKHDPGFPIHAVRYCLREGQVALGDLRYVAFYDSLWSSSSACSRPTCRSPRAASGPS
jgi:carbamoyltransferase